MLGSKTDHKSCKENTYFPKIMIAMDKSLIVLFSAKNIGIVLQNGSAAWNNGAFCNSWDMESFRNYNKNITLFNMPE